MSSNFVGLLIVLLLGFASMNVIMATRNAPVLLAWLNQILIGIILIVAMSYLVVRVSTRKMIKKGGVAQGEHK